MSRIRTNLITNRMANGAPTVSNGLVISGVTTSTNVSVASSVTATTFYGSGANLTGITQTTINNNADNRIITGSGTANTLEGEANLTFDGSSLGVKRSGGGDVAVNIECGNTISQSRILFRDSSDIDGIITYDHNDRKLYLGAGTNAATDGDITIDSSGRVLIGTTTVGENDADDLTIANSAHAGITLRSGTSSQGAIYFSDATSGAAQYDGFLGYNQSDRTMFFGTAQATRIRIDSSGRLLLGTSTAGHTDLDDLTISTSGHTGITIRSGTSSLGVVGFADGTSGNTQYRGVIQYRHSNDSMEFNTADAKRMTIDGNGQITKPYQASFAAYVGSNPYTLNNQVFPFNNTIHNIGSHFNTSNYRFTAPVAGRYLFNFHSIFQSNGQQDVQIRVNNSSGMGKMFHVSQTGGNWDQASCSYILNLNANDYVTMWSVSNTGWHGNNWGMFSGELLS